MCGHCGCREVVPIGRLMTEHERLLDLAEDARRAVRAGDAAAARQIITALTGLLIVHTRAEEAGLFAVMRATADFTDHIDRLQAEHAGLMAMLATGLRPGAIPGICDTLREHIHAEEYGLFPAALASLGGDDWEAVSAREAAGSGVAGADLPQREGR